MSREDIADFLGLKKETSAGASGTWKPGLIRRLTPTHPVDRSQALRQLAQLGFCIPAASDGPSGPDARSRFSLADLSLILPHRESQSSKDRTDLEQPTPRLGSVRHQNFSTSSWWSGSSSGHCLPDLPGTSIASDSQLLGEGRSAFAAA